MHEHVFLMDSVKEHQSKRSLLPLGVTEKLLIGVLSNDKLKHIFNLDRV